MYDNELVKLIQNQEKADKLNVNDHDLYDYHPKKNCELATPTKVIWSPMS